ALLVFGIAGAFITSLTNGDRLVYGPTVLRGLSEYDGFSAVLELLVLFLPFLLARKFLADEEGHKILLTVLCLMAVVYAFLALYEVRMSPQINNMVYGFFPHNWRQHVRGGGYRPLVFLNHGLWLGIFFCYALIATIALAKHQSKRVVEFAAAALFLGLTLVLMRSLGALLIAIVLAPAILFLSSRMQLFVAAGFSSAVLLYPMLRSIDLVPVNWFLNVAGRISFERASSLRFRIENEDALLAKAQERSLFGWGGWGRSRLFDEFGRGQSVTDGYWVILFGTGGWVKYVAFFGLLTLPIILMAFMFRRGKISAITTGLALALTANMIDLIPNATFTPITLLMAGALAGHFELLTSKSPAVPQPSVAQETVTDRRSLQYQREQKPSAAAGSRRNPAVTKRPNEAVVQRGKGTQLRRGVTNPYRRNLGGDDA
ncbi:MAG: hypothetical protein AAGB07_20690, partial [Pseudomonadota bacterium]